MKQLLQRLRENLTIDYKHKWSLFAVETPVPVLGLGQGFKGSSADVEDKNADIKWNYRALRLPAVRPSIIFCLCFPLSEPVQANIICQSSISITIISVIRNLIKGLHENAAVVAGFVSITAFALHNAASVKKSPPFKDRLGWWPERRRRNKAKIALQKLVTQVNELRGLVKS